MFLSCECKQVCENNLHSFDSKHVIYVFIVTLVSLAEMHSVVNKLLTTQQHCCQLVKAIQIVFVLSLTCVIYLTLLFL